MPRCGAIATKKQRGRSVDYGELDGVGIGTRRSRLGSNQCANTHDRWPERKRVGTDLGVVGYLSLKLGGGGGGLTGVGIFVPCL